MTYLRRIIIVMTAVLLLTTATPPTFATSPNPSDFEDAISAECRSALQEVLALLPPGGGPYEVEHAFHVFWSTASTPCALEEVTRANRPDGEIQAMPNTEDAVQDTDEGDAFFDTGDIDLGCTGPGLGRTVANLIVLGNSIELATDPIASGEMSAAAVHEIDAQGLVFGMTANSKGTGTIRIGPLLIPSLGDAAVECGIQTAKICKKIFWIWTVCVDTSTIFACEASGRAWLGIPRAAEFGVDGYLKSVC